MAFAYEEVKSLSLPAQDIKALEIDCGAGFLKVYGREGMKSIEVEAEIVLEGMSDMKAKRFIRGKINLSLEKRGSRAVLISRMRRYTSLFPLFKTKVINLTVNMPKNIGLSIDDGSGKIIVEGIQGRVDIEDGSGMMSIVDITGSVIIDDGSGSIQVVGVRGDVDIDDSSGNVRVESISGSVSIDDGSGTIEIRNIGANVTVNDGSGSIHIDGVEGNVVIEEDGSGGLSISNVKGTVRK